MNKIPYGFKMDLSRCRVCGDSIIKNNPRQVVKYCSKECRTNRLGKK